MPPSPTHNSAYIRDFLRSNRAIQLLCLLIALLFWLIVKLSEDYRTNFEMPIRYDLPEAQTFSKPPPRTLDVIAEGRGWSLLGYLFSKTPTLLLEVPQGDRLALAGSSLRSRAEVYLKSGLTVIETRPEYMNLSLEAREEKLLPLVLVQDIQTASNYHLLSPPTIDPDTVVVSGPASALEPLDSWSTQRVVLQDVRENLSQWLPLEIPPNRQLRFEPDKVRLDVEVERTTEQAFFIPIKLVNAPDDSVRIFPNQVKVSFRVGVGAFETVRESDFSVQVDMSKVNPGQQSNTIPILVKSNNPAVLSFYFSPKAVEFFFQQPNRAVDTLPEKG